MSDEKKMNSEEVKDEQACSCEDGKCDCSCRCGCDCSCSCGCENGECECTCDFDDAEGDCHCNCAGCRCSKGERRMRSRIFKMAGEKGRTVELTGIATATTLLVSALLKKVIRL